MERVGERGLSLTELLAIVIGTGNADNNALRLAELLLAHVGGLEGLTRATTSEMEDIKGIGPVTSIKIRAALELGRRAMARSEEKRVQITSPADVANLLMSEMMHLEQEHLRVVILDTRNRVLETPTIYIGSQNTVVARIGELFKAAIRINAAAIIVVHNHPSGDPSPSPEDIEITRQLITAGKLLDIVVLDHIIIGHQRYVSLKERSLAFE